MNHVEPWTLLDQKSSVLSYDEDEEEDEDSDIFGESDKEEEYEDENEGKVFNHWYKCDLLDNNNRC